MSEHRDRATRTMASGSEGSEESFLYECDPCKNQKKTSEAKGYCTVCTEYLCEACERSHRGSKATCDHNILTGKDIPKLPVMYCEVHKSMVLNSFCKSHDDVICDTCKITDHNKCVITDVSNQTKQVNVINALDEAVKSLTHLKNQYKTLKASRGAEKGRVKSQLRKCLDDMRKMRKEIDQTFDKLERKFEKEVGEKEEQTTKEIEGHVTIADDALIQISDQIKTLGVCRKTKDDDVMFVGMKKANKLNSKYDQTKSNVQQTVSPIEIRFRPNHDISDVMQQLDYIGTLESNRHSSLRSRRTASLLRMSIIEREIGVGTNYVYDCTFMKSGHLVLACKDVLLLLDESFSVQSRLPTESIRVAAIKEDEVVVSKGVDKQLLRVQLFPQMKVKATVKMCRECLGVDVFGDEIYVACKDDEGHVQVQVLSLDGAMKRKIPVQKHGNIYNVKVSLDGSKVFASYWDTHKVACFDQQGKMIYQYSDPDLRCPCGLYVDEEDNLLVCGYGSNNIHIVDRDGRKEKVWLTQKDGVADLRCVSYRARDGVLVVGLMNTDKPLIVFLTKMS